MNPVGVTLECRAAEALALLYRIGAQYPSAAFASSFGARIDSIDALWDVATQTRKASPAALQMSAIGRAALKPAQPIFVDRYSNNPTTRSFILIDETTNNTIAAGLIQ
jgi:bifunctional enzyme CysN/CysC